MNNYREELEEKQSLKLSKTTRTVKSYGDGTSKTYTTSSCFVNGEKQDEPQKDERPQQPQQAPTTSITINNQCNVPLAPAPPENNTPSPVYASQRKFPVTNEAPIRLIARQKLPRTYLFVGCVCICLFLVLATAFVSMIAYHWIIGTNNTTPLLNLPVDNTTPLAIFTTPLTEINLTTASTMTIPSTTTTATTTPTLIEVYGSKGNDDPAKVEIFCLHDFTKISNYTKHVKILSTNNQDADSQRFDWNTVQPIKNGSIHLEIARSNNNIRHIRNVLVWLRPVIQNLTIDSTFANYYCSHNITDFRYDTELVTLPKVKLLHFYNMNYCFVEKYLRNLKFPNLVELKIFGSDKLKNYYDLLKKLIVHETPTVSVFRDCENGSSPC